MGVKLFWGLVVLAVLICGIRVANWKKWEKAFNNQQINYLKSRLSEPVDKQMYDCRFNINGIRLYVPLSICVSSKLDIATAGDEVNLEVTKTIKGKNKAIKVEVVKHKLKPVISWFWWQKVLGDLRSDSIDIFKKILPEPEAGLMAGIVLGEKGMLSSKYSDALIKTGTMHVVAASGYNVSVIAGVVMKGMVMILPRRKAAMGSMLMIWVYVVLAGGDPPVVRAGIMASLVMLSWMSGREYWVILGFGLSVISMLTVSPYLIQNVSFQLSMAATAGVVFVVSGLEGWIKPVENKIKQSLILKSVVQNSLTTIAAIAATAPISLITFGEVSMLGLVVNPVVLSMIPMLMYLGLVGVVSGLIWLPLAIPVCWLALPVASLWSQIIIMASSIPVGSFQLSFNWWIAVGWWMLLASFTLMGRERLK